MDENSRERKRVLSVERRIRVVHIAFSDFIEDENMSLNRFDTLIFNENNRRHRDLSTLILSVKNIEFGLK